MFKIPITLLLMTQLLYSSTVRAMDDNIKFSGTLVSIPCVIPSGEENITLDFGTIINKYLYANQRSKSQPFVMHLTECDPSIAKTVSVTFSGTESTELPGLLALDSGSKATGIAIGLESDTGEQQLFNHISNPVSLAKGDNWLKWQAYIRGEPSALTNETITAGEFTATATFQLSYE